MSSSRRFKRQSKRPTPEWFPQIIEQFQRCGVDTTPQPGANHQKRQEPEPTSAEYGELIDRLMDKDRAYFAAHPTETEYVPNTVYLCGSVCALGAMPAAKLKVKRNNSATDGQVSVKRASIE